MNLTGRDKPKRNDPCYCGSGKKYKHCHLKKERQAMTSGNRGLLGAYEERNPNRVPAHHVRPGVVSPMRPVPESIPRPEYAGGARLKGRPPLLKSPEVLERMRRACRAAREILEETKAAVAPGVTTEELDVIAHEAYIRHGGYPSPLGYHGYPKSICTSVNEVICHGIPDSRPLEAGDIVNVDVTIFLDGVHGDLSETIAVGEIDEQSQRLVTNTHECLMLGIEQVRPGADLNNVGTAIENHAKQAGFGVVREFVGHGIGELFHMEPQVHHYRANIRYRLEPGLVFTIEPMINIGDWRHVLWDDGWTAVTSDLQRSAQFEHTIAVTEKGVEILTLPEGTPQPFAH